MKSIQRNWLALGLLSILTLPASPTVLEAQEAFTLPPAKVGVAYEFRIETEGGLPPLQWRVVHGELPPGIELPATGVFKGIPTVARQQPFEFAVEVADSAQPPQRIVQQFSLAVSPATLRLVLNATALKIVPPAKTAATPDPVPSVLPEETSRQEIPYAPPHLPHWVVPLRQDQPTQAATPPPTSTTMDPNGQTQPTSGQGNQLDPSTFIRVYEDTKTGQRRLIYAPDGHEKGPALKLTADEASSIVIEPYDGKMGDDPGFNKLYMMAKLASGDSSKDVVVNGYAEVGKDKATMAAQSATAFQSAANVQAMILNMAYTAGDIIYAVYQPHAETTAEAMNFQTWLGKHEEVDFRSGDSQKITASIATAIQGKKYGDENIQRLRERLRLYQPEIRAISDFFVQKENLAIVEKVGVKIFWIDRDSMKRIAQQYQDNIRIAFDPKSTDDAQAEALQDLLERTKLVYKDFGDLRAEIKIRMQKTVSEEEAKAGKPLELTNDQWTIRYQKAIQDYAKDVRKSVVRELKRTLATGSISLTDNKAKDGDRLTLTVESLPSDGSTAGISAVFEIAIKKYGAKIQWSPSLLFVRRLGLKDSEVTPPAGSTTAPLNRVNFAPSPGMTFGLAYFKRGNSGWDKFMRGVGPGFGINVSFMNFNDPSFNLATGQFVNTSGTNVQVGAGLIGSLFDNKLQLTYGWNLNVERRRTYFGVGFGFIEIGKEVAKYVTK